MKTARYFLGILLLAGAAGLLIFGVFSLYAGFFASDLLQTLEGEELTYFIVAGLMLFGICLLLARIAQQAGMRLIGSPPPPPRARD